MANIFKTEIISPEKIIFSEDSKMVTFPSYEGDMSVLENHISLITFLRPGIIKVQNKDEGVKEFFVEDGTVEFSGNNLIVLSSSAIDVKSLTKEFINELNKDTEQKLENKDISDHERYILNHKLNTIKEIRI